MEESKHRREEDLRIGGAIFHHEGIAPSGEPFYLIVKVSGKQIESYFDYIAHDNLVTEYGLKKFGEILYHDSHPLSDEAVNSLLEKHFGRDK